MPKKAACLAVATLIVAPAAPAAAQPARPQETAIFGVDVKLVAVPVFVTDKAGRAVAGLTAADFEVEEQGKRVPIVAFFPVDAAGTSPAADSGALVQAAAHRQILFLFDLTFSTPAGIQRARRAAAAFVRESLAASDLAAVATFGQAGIQVLVAFTPDRSQVERAIQGLGLVETQRRLPDRLNIAYDLGVPAWGPGIGPPSGDPLDQYLIQMAQLMARGDQGLYRQRIESFLSGVEQLVRTLDSIQGRKQLILLSAGFDSTVTGGAQGQEKAEASSAVESGRLWEVPSDRHFGDAAARGALDRLFKAVAATDTVIHTIDVTGLSAGAAVDQAQPRTPTGRGRDTLAELAANTGGRFVGDSNDLQRGLAEILESSRHYYVLAFEPPDEKSKPDRMRSLKVRVRRGGLDVSHRRGYSLATAGTGIPLSGSLRAAEAIAKGLSGGTVPLRGLAVPYRNVSGEHSLAVILQIDGRALARGVTSRQLDVEVVAYAFDSQGQIRDAVSVAPAIDLGAVGPALETNGLQVITSFAVDRGPVDLRFAVREKTTQQAGFLRLPTEMPDFEAGRIVLAPPLAMDDPRKRLVLPAPSRGRPGLEIPFRLADMPFTAEPLPTLSNGAAREFCVMAWRGRDSGARGSLEFDAHLVDDAGVARKVPVDGVPRLVGDADGFERYVATLVPRGVAPGSYVLRVALFDRASGMTGRSELALRIE